jgi:uncharacterized LabA/DUF88 family protein
MAKFVYVDNSNVWIGGMQVSAVRRELAFDIRDAINRKVFDYDWKYDFGKLLDFVAGPQNGLKRAVLLGSRPPQNDRLWSAAKSNGFEVFVLDRNVQNEEKMVDTGIVTEMMADSYERIQNKAEDEIILVAGDSDYVPIVKHIANRGIRVIVFYWEHASRDLKNVATQFVSLDEHVDAIRRG